MDQGVASDGAPEKRQFLVHMDPDLIRRIKILAIKRDVTASDLVQAAVVEFLARHESTQPNAGPSETIACS